MATALNPVEPSPLILIADADSAARALNAASCMAQGWDVVEAANGRDALVRALMHPPSIAVLDLQLPVIDGFSLCEILRKDRMTAAVPVIALTDAAHPTDDTRALHAGVDLVLTKPTPSETLIVEAHRLMMQSRELWQRAQAASIVAAEQRRRAEAFADRQMKSRVRRQQATTTTPPSAPPTLHCLECEGVLKYERSYVGGVNDRQREQWDYYTCSRCGTFQYRHRTRKLRWVG